MSWGGRDGGWQWTTATVGVARGEAPRQPGLLVRVGGGHDEAPAVERGHAGPGGEAGAHRPQGARSGGAHRPPPTQSSTGPPSQPLGGGVFLLTKKPAPRGLLRTIFHRVDPGRFPAWHSVFARFSKLTERNEEREKTKTFSLAPKTLHICLQSPVRVWSDQMYPYKCLSNANSGVELTFDTEAQNDHLRGGSVEAPGRQAPQRVCGDSGDQKRRFQNFSGGQKIPESKQGHAEHRSLRHPSHQPGISSRG